MPEEPQNPDEIRLADRAPLYHAFLPDRPDGVVWPREAQAARALCRELIESRPDAVRHCQGKTAEEVRRIFAANS